MNRRLTPFTLLLITVLCVGFVGAIAPTANFTATPVEGVGFLSVTFTDTSTNLPTLWNWSFGDGNTTGNTTQNTIHLYTDPGLYTVSLIAENVDGSDTATKIDYILVGVSQFTPVGPISGMFPLNVDFTDTSTGTPTEWDWTFRNVTGNNTEVSFSVIQNPTFTGGIGNYLIRLKASDIYGGYNTSIQTTYVNISYDAIVSDFLAVPTSGKISAMHFDVAFTDLSVNATSWYWTYGDGWASKLQNPSHSYTTSGSYDVSLTVWNIVGYTDTETKTAYINITGNPIEPNIAVVPINASFVIFGAIIMLSVLSLLMLVVRALSQAGKGNAGAMANILPEFSMIAMVIIVVIIGFVVIAAVLLSV